MSQQNIAQLDQLFKKNKTEEAKKIIGDFFKSKWQAKEEGAAYLQFIKTYLYLNNSINKAYKEYLQEAIAVLKRINKQEIKNEQILKIKKIRKKISEA